MLGVPGSNLDSGSGRFSLHNISRIEKVLQEVRTGEYTKRRAFYEAKYPNRSRGPKHATLPTVPELEEFEAGWTTVPGASVHLASNAKEMKLPPSHFKSHRMTLAMAAPNDWQVVEEPRSWTYFDAEGSPRQTATVGA